MKIENKKTIRNYRRSMRIDSFVMAVLVLF